jgi:hypothetical protein
MIDFSTEIIVESSSENIWSIILDFAHYPQWNPFTPIAAGEPKVGAPVMLHARLYGKKPLRSPHHIVELVPGHKLSWAQDSPPSWLLRAVRSQIVEPQGPGRARFINRMVMEGPLAHLTYWIMGPAILRGFGDVSRALKARAEGAGLRACPYK